jgi:hypothetical protein
MDRPRANEIHEEYEPPMVEDIPLHAEEQLLVGCKTTFGTGTGRASAQFACGVCRIPTAS